MTTALVPQQRGELSITEHLERWDSAVIRYFETRKGGPEGNTAKTYKRTLQSYKDFALESGLLPWAGDALIAYNRLQQGLRKVNGGELADDTIAARLTHVAAFFRWAYGYHLTSLSPDIVGDLLDKPSRRKLSPRDILEPNEVKAMLEMTKSAREHALVRLLVDGGLRVSEAVSLLPDNVYPASGRWYVEVRGKGDKVREVEIDAGLADELLALKVADFVPLLNMSRYTAFRWVRDIAERAGVKKTLSPHCFRHTHAHHLRLLGWPLEAISDRLGHSSTAITEVYTRPAKLARAVTLPSMPWHGDT